MLFSKEKIWKSWNEIYISKPSKKRKFSKGIDGISIEDFKKKEVVYIDNIYRQLEGGFFVFDKLLHYQIKRKGKKPRDIQAPTIRDRIIQKIINEKLVNQYFKNKFDKAGIVGSVEGNSIRDIIRKVLDYYKNGYVHILKTDIISYFPSINKLRLKKIIVYYIKDKTIKKLLYDYLATSKLSGIPQGPPLSPLMANLYLMKLDQYLEKRKKIKHIRYVDDVLIFCKTKNDTKKAYNFLYNYFAKVDLKIHALDNDTKTKIGLLNKDEIDILGVVYKNNKLIIKKEKYIKFIHDVIDPLCRKDYILSMEGKTREIKIDKFIEKLNYQLNGWGNAYSFCNAENIFCDLDKKIQDKLMQCRIKYKEKRKILKSIIKLSRIKIKPII